MKKKVTDRQMEAHKEDGIVFENERAKAYKIVHHHFFAGGLSLVFLFFD
jgi:hypothetical protein